MLSERVLEVMGAKPRNTTGPNAHNQVDPRVTAAHARLCG